MPSSWRWILPQVARYFSYQVGSCVCLKQASAALMIHTTWELAGHQINLKAKHLLRRSGALSLKLARTSQASDAFEARHRGNLRFTKRLTALAASDVEIHRR